MANTQIVSLLIDKIVEQLTLKLQTEIDEDDPTRADVVKAGRFLGNPKVDNIYAYVSGGDPDNLEYLDGICSLEDHKRIGLYVPVREVGGGTAWWRRGIVQLGCYFLSGTLTEDQARAYAYEFYGRICANIENIQVAQLIDDYGERAYRIFQYGSTLHPSGGNGKWIWRGKILWECLTNRT